MPAAPSNPRRTQLSLSTRSVGLIVATVAAVTALIAITQASIRVLGWMAAAASMAALLEPGVNWLAQRMRRGVAVLLTVVVTLGTIGGLAFLTVQDVLHEVHVLQEAAPRSAAALEKSDRFGSAARSFKLEEKTRSLVKEIPGRLRGGSNADALRAAGTRGVSYLATFVLTIFLILNGRKLVHAGLAQIPDEKRRRRLHDALRDGGTRGVEYATGSLAMAAFAGALVTTTARVVDVPGAVPLGLWAVLWDLVPLLGAVIGALPVAVLAAASSPTTGLVVLVVFLAYEGFEVLVLQRRLERASTHVGAFLTLVAGSVGLELYGLGGALFALFGVSVALGVLDAWRASAPSA